jgi:hypothetical protein
MKRYLDQWNIIESPEKDTQTQNFYKVTKAIQGRNESLFKKYH